MGCGSSSMPAADDISTREATARNASGAYSLAGVPPKATSWQQPKTSTAVFVVGNSAMGSSLPSNNSNNKFSSVPHVEITANDDDIAAPKDGSAGGGSGGQRVSELETEVMGEGRVSLIKEHSSKIIESSNINVYSSVPGNVPSMLHDDDDSSFARASLAMSPEAEQQRFMNSNLSDVKEDTAKFYEGGIIVAELEEFNQSAVVYTVGSGRASLVEIAPPRVPPRMTVETKSRNASIVAASSAAQTSSPSSRAASVVHSTPVSRHASEAPIPLSTIESGVLLRLSATDKELLASVGRPSADSYEATLPIRPAELDASSTLDLKEFKHEAKIEEAVSLRSSLDFVEIKQADFTPTVLHGSIISQDYEVSSSAPPEHPKVRFEEPDITTTPVTQSLNVLSSPLANVLHDIPEVPVTRPYGLSYGVLVRPTQLIAQLEQKIATEPEKKRPALKPKSSAIRKSYQHKKDVIGISSKPKLEEIAESTKRAETRRREASIKPEYGFVKRQAEKFSEPPKKALKLPPVSNH
eukprot:TRINITY_DN17573_c0_g1_i1.p1 TRINITY_DN17573_c0_g1~~TRINITY_DN17573_c0_g1_i1.p1  ORF type:complete len:524 (+),score=142.60 TRINITY_DN17573_c0_g1_i1:113-1684(+)